MDFYRGDTREPKAIKIAGFKAWEPMSVEEARAHVLSYCGMSPPQNPLDLSRLIISSPQKPYVSTAPDEGCGGYSTKGFVYKIQFNGLRERKIEEAVGKPIQIRPLMMWPTLLMDADTIAEANVIVMKHRNNAGELTFFTSIPVANITASRPANGKSFSAL